MAGSGSNIEDVRRANLGTVLRLVHHSGSLSRAVLAQRTGLNRSTIGSLVATLVEHRLVNERDPDPTRRVGRPSPTVAPSSDVVVIAANPEVDGLEIGAVSLDGSVRHRVRHDVGHLISPGETADRIATTLREWRSGELAGVRVVGVGTAVPGLVRASDGIVRNAPHLGWGDVDLAAAIRSATGLPATIGNDASLGAIAESLFGAARDHADVVYLNGGASGIGGGIVLRGEVVAGTGGYAGEWGQNLPVLASETDRRAPGGTLEDEVNRARLFEALGVGDDHTLGEALTGSGSTIDEVDRQRRILASALANAANVLNPSIVVLGGFLATLREADPGTFDAQVREQMLAEPAEDLTLSSAALADDRLLIGAAELLFEALIADPLGHPPS